MGLTNTFRVLASLPSDQALPLIKGALSEPYPEIQARAFELTRTLNRPDLIIEHYSYLLPDTRNRILEDKKTYLDAAKKQTKYTGERVRRSAYEFLSTAGDIEVVDLLAAGLNDVSTLVRSHAADALEKIGLRYYNHLINAQLAGEEDARAYIDRHIAIMLEALETLLHTYQVHRKDVFVQITAESGPDAYWMIPNIVLARRESQLYDAFLRIMDHASSTAAIDTIFRLFTDKEERIQEIGRIIFHRRKDKAFIVALAKYFSTLSHDKAAQYIARIQDIPWWDTLSTVEDMTAGTMVEHLCFIAQTPLAPRVYDKFLDFFLNSPHREVRIEALHTLRDKQHNRLVESCRKLMQDPSDEVKLAAAHIVIEINLPDKIRLLSPHIKSEHEELRRVCMQEVAQASFQRYLATFDKLDPKTREMAARAIAKIDNHMVNRLTDEINSLDPARRLKALQILDWANIESNAQPAIRTLLNDPDIRVRATAIKLVELSGNIDAMREVIHLLNDPDRRVRANAVEAFEEIGDNRFVKILLPFCQDPDNRVRANAAKALWNLGQHEVLDVIERMLQDPDENMRLSAVWAFGEIKPESAMEILSARVDTETSDKVRAKIESVREELRRA